MINFVGLRNIAFSLYACLVLTFGGLFFYRRFTTGSAFAYSVEFTGGTELQLKLNEAVPLPQISSIISSGGWDEPLVQRYSDTEFLVRLKAYENDVQGLGSRIIGLLNTKLKPNRAELVRAESVGPGVGKDLRSDAIKAILLALALMLLYIAIRFRFAYAVGAVGALAHDAIAILLCFMLFGMEISVSVIGALLATLGYSINDTIVIFSRIRESLRRSRGFPLPDVINDGIRHTLKRTLLTSLSTFLVVGSLFFFGGESLRALSFALLVGIVVGTYSSIFVASPIMMLLYKEK